MEAAPGSMYLGFYRWRLIVLLWAQLPSVLQRRGEGPAGLVKRTRLGLGVEVAILALS